MRRPEPVVMAHGLAASVAPPAPGRLSTFVSAAGYWLGIPFRWAYQMAHNGHGIARVLDITKFRPLPAGLVPPGHPWVTGINPATGQPIWHDNVLYRSARTPDADGLPDDDEVVTKTGRFLAASVAESAAVPEIPRGPRRRMPHGINYIHGTSHHNSGLLVFTDFRDGLRHFSDRRFRAEVWRFVREENRELLLLFRQRDYRPREFAYFVCAMRTLFPFFCNSNGPRGRVLWGNAAPFPAANLITGAWVTDVYALKRPGGRGGGRAAPGGRQTVLRRGPYHGHRDAALWPERGLAWLTYWRIRLRGGKGGVFFIDRRKLYADQIQQRERLGVADEPIARM